MDKLDTLEKIEEYLKRADCYGDYNYCFVVQPEDTVSDVILMCFGAIGGAIAGVRKATGTVGYIFNKNEKGIGLIPIEKIGNEKEVVLAKTMFLRNEDIDKISIKYDTIGKLIKIKMKDKSKYGFKVTRKIRNIDYHEINLNKFIESCR